jgi:outer membrane receptor protein involved in Fe transport
VYRAINRPNYTEVIPYSDPRAGAQSGNPKLQPAYGNCVDLRYEIYPQREEVFTAGVFYKQINNAIENIVAPGSENTSFQNVAICTNYGLELVAMKYFGNFGFSANYTYTHSEVSDTWHDFAYKNNIYDTVIAINKTRPLVGQSPHLFNLSVSYRNARMGFKSSITYTLQGYNLVAKNDHYHFDSYQATYHNLGLTIEQKIGKRFFATVKVSNLLNSPISRYMRDENNTLIEKAYNYQSYYIGLKISI